MDEFVYFAKNSAGNIKIGLSSNPQERIRALRTADPGYQIVATIQGDRGLEKELHEKFSELNMGGEIFSLAEELSSFIDSINSSSSNEHYYYTTDLSKFAIDAGENRAISNNHVEKIKSSILKVGVRRELPIIVKRTNGLLVVVDGQHRLKATQELKSSRRIPDIGIWYIIADSDWNHETTAITNDTQESWDLREYFDLYVKQSKKEYLLLSSFMDEYDMIPLTVALALSQGSEAGFMAANSDAGKSIKSGQFVFTHYDYAHLMGKMIKDIHHFFKKSRDIGGMSRFAQTAFITFVRCEKIDSEFNPVEYDHDRMMDQMEKNKHLLRKQRTIDNWKDHFKEIYNYNKRGKDKIRF